MKSRNRASLLEFVLLAAVLLAAAGTRFWYVHTYATTAAPVRVQGELGREVETLVSNLNQGHGFASPAPDGLSQVKRLDVAPLYPWLLAQLGPANSELDLLQERARWAQCALGTLTAGLLFLFARQAFGSVLVAGVTGFVAAFYPFWILNTAEINDGVLASFLLALVLFLAVRSRFEEFGASWLLGMSLAALALTRAALLPFALVCLLWFLRRCQATRSRAVAALLVVFGFASGLMPWMIRNYEIAHDVFPIVDSTYLHLWMGSHEGASGGPVRPSAEQMALTDHDRAVAVIDSVTSDGSATLRRRFSAALYFLFGQEWFMQQRLLLGPDPENVQAARAAGFLEVTLLSTLLAVLLLAFLGWRWSYPWYESAGPLTLAVLWIPLPYILGHAEALSGPRLPLDGPLICLAAYALAGMAVWTREFRLSRPAAEEE
jgi:hypothetical protein